MSSSCLWPLLASCRTSVTDDAPDDHSAKLVTLPCRLGPRGSGVPADAGWCRVSGKGGQGAVSGRVNGRVCGPTYHVKR